MANRTAGMKLRKWSKLALLLAIVALFAGACAKNEPPVIESVTAEKAGNSASEYKVVCKATDANNDTLLYLWSTDGGIVRGTGDNIKWNAPETSGTYTIRVTVKDTKGGEATGSTNIKVEVKPVAPPEPIEPPKPKANQPPVIVELTSEKTRVRIWTTTTIQCVAEDPDGDELTYIWAAPKGKIQGEGSTVGWTAPGDSGEYTVPITVKVDDGKGEQAEKSIDIEVFCCGSG